MEHKQAKVNDIIKSMDFPGVDDHFMIGIVTSVEEHLIRCKMIKAVRYGEVVTEQAPSEFSTPQPGWYAMDDTFTGRVTIIG